MPAQRWTNADGLQVAFPDTFKANPRRYNQTTGIEIDGAFEQIEIDVDLVSIATGTVSYSSDLNNDGTADGFSLADGYIPANSSVTRVLLVMTEAAVGGTSFTVGTYLKNGTAIGATSLITATEGVLANVNAIGKRIYGAGSLVSAAAGTAGVGTSDAFIGIAPTGTFTAGKGRLIIEYMQSVPDSASS